MAIDQEMTRDERARHAAREFANSVNEMGFDVESFVDEFQRQHRTLQQNGFGAFLALVKAWSELPENRYDARNEWTCEKSREIVKALGEYNLRPPFI